MSSVGLEQHPCRDILERLHANHRFLNLLMKKDAECKDNTVRSAAAEGLRAPGVTKQEVTYN